MARTIMTCAAVALVACATSPKQLQFDTTPGQLTIAGSPPSRGPDAVWSGEAQPPQTRRQWAPPRTAAVHFHTGTATIDPASYPLLDEAAETFKVRRDVTRIVVEGHTDSSGGERINATLSQERAEAVRAYLVKKGVDPKRLEARGFGASHPIASNATERGRAANRRVDFDLRTTSP